MVKEENKEKKPRGSSHLGKEAKIGVAVIGALLLVLGAVAAVRLTGSSADDKLAMATDGDNGKERFGKEGKNDLLFRDLKPRHNEAGNQVTFVKPEPESIKPPKHVDNIANRWESPHDKGNTRGGGGGNPELGLPTPPIVDPLKPPGGDRPDHHNRPVPGFAAKPEARDALHLREVDSEVSLTRPDEDRHPRPGHMGAGRSDPDGFAEAESLATPPPVGMEPPPRSSAGGFASSSPRVTPFEASEPRFAAAEPTYNRIPPHRRDGVASLSTPPARREDGKYEVQPNDSFWTISERLYGTGAYFKALAQQNHGKGASEDRLRPGDLISAPTVAQLEKSYPDLCPKPSHRETLQSQSRVSDVSTRPYRAGRTYTVAEGDTLFNIARYELGKASRWAEIYEINRDVLGKDFNYLTPGTQLALPEGDKSDSLTRQPGDGGRRLR